MTTSDQGPPADDRKIRVGIIATGGWAKYGHIHALRSLDGFEISAVASRRLKTAKKLPPSSASSMPWTTSGR